jgi:hypothetical protein
MKKKRRIPYDEILGSGRSVDVTQPVSRPAEETPFLR